MKGLSFASRRLFGCGPLGLCYKPSHFNGWESNKLLLSPPLYEGYWFRTQSLLFGNPTNPSMTVLGPRWLYEAEH